MSDAAKITFRKNDRGDLIPHVDGKKLLSSELSIVQKVGAATVVRLEIYLLDGVVVDEG